MVYKGRNGQCVVCVSLIERATVKAVIAKSR